MRFPTEIGVEAAKDAALGWRYCSRHSTIGVTSIVSSALMLFLGFVVVQHPASSPQLPEKVHTNTSLQRSPQPASLITL